MVEWSKIKCTQCPSRKKCKKTNISKGSQACQVRRKMIEPKEKEKGITQVSIIGKVKNIWK